MTVHPRWRGEHGRLAAAQDDLVGSSPLARGTLFSVTTHVLLLRFIPAGAGNTLAAGGLLAPGSVHPRWRGEHDYFGAPNATAIGSSPLARGTLLLRPRVETSLPVHPRWRGEHCLEER